MKYESKNPHEGRPHTPVLSTLTSAVFPVEADLERLETYGIIEPVKFTEWAEPIVPVRKKDGSVRICVRHCQKNKL